jgi:AcrR family transcriptional regulator
MALEAAASIVDEAGYAGLSARRIAQGIGYTPGTLYLVFRNLDALVLELNGRTLDGLDRMLQDAVAGSGSPREAIQRLGAAYIRTAFDRKGRWLMVFEHRLPEGEPLPDAYQARIDRLFQLVEQQLALLAPTRSKDETRLAARALWGGLHGISLLAVGEKLEAAGVASAAAMADCLVGHFLNGYLHRED